MASSATGPPDVQPRWGWVFGVVWLAYLSENLSALLRREAGWWRTVGLVALAGFVVAYVLVLGHLRRRRFGESADAADRGVTGGRRSPSETRAAIAWVALAAMLVLGALQLPGAGVHTLTCLVFVAATAMMGLPRRPGVAVAVTLVVAAEVLLRLMPGWRAAGHGYSLAIVLGALATGGIRLALDRQRRLMQAQRELAALAVAQERGRIAADLHDILGHSLTVVAVKAELAQRLLEVDLGRARAELRDLEALARDALADVRATTLGMRGISLPGEIAAAREALAAADIEAELPGAADEVPTRNRELFAWTIREAITNVVRHSGARHVSVRLRPDSVEIVDDGDGRSGSALGSGGAGVAAPGQGLAGLQRRAEEAGGRLTAGRAGPADGVAGFRVRVEVPR